MSPCVGIVGGAVTARDGGYIERRVRRRHVDTVRCRRRPSRTITVGSRCVSLRRCSFRWTSGMNHGREALPLTLVRDRTRRPRSHGCYHMIPLPMFVRISVG